MSNYLDKEKLLEAFDAFSHSQETFYKFEDRIESGEFDVEISPPEGYMLASIEDYNNKSKLLKEKDAEINRLKERLQQWVW
jgi:major membrane immunogen (membrane-anchored lipoprotein)